MTDKPKRPMIKNVATAPMIYFDQAPTLGLMHNVVELDLAARVLTTNSDSSVVADTVCVAHLRCSIDAALMLRTAIDKALKMAGHVPVEADVLADPSPGEALARRIKELNS